MGLRSKETLGGDFGGSSPGARLSIVVKNSSVRCRSLSCSLACFSSVYRLC